MVSTRLCMHSNHARIAMHTYVVLIRVSDSKENMLHYLTAELNSVEAVRYDVIQCQIQHTVH